MMMQHFFNKFILRLLKFDDRDVLLIRSQKPHPRVATAQQARARERGDRTCQNIRSTTLICRRRTTPLHPFPAPATLASQTRCLHTTQAIKNPVLKSRFPIVFICVRLLMRPAALLTRNVQTLHH